MAIAEMKNRAVSEGESKPIPSPVILARQGSWAHDSQKQFMALTGERMLDTCIYRFPGSRAKCAENAWIIDSQGGAAAFARALRSLREAVTLF